MKNKKYLYIVAILLSFNNLFACDCSPSVTANFQKSLGKITAEYGKLATSLSAFDTEIKELIKKTKKENIQLNRTIATEEQKNIRIAQLRFYIQKITQKSALNLQAQTNQAKHQLLDTKQFYYEEKK
jgi:hypothetical protein